MPQINITGNSSKAPEGPKVPYTPGDRALANYMNDAQDTRHGWKRQEAEHFNRQIEALQKQKRSILERINKNLARDNSKWSGLTERAEREDFAWEQRNTRQKQSILTKINKGLQGDALKWSKLHDRADRDDYSWEQRQTRRKQQTIDRFNSSLAKNMARQQAAQEKAAYTSMRYDANQMNNLFDQQNSRKGVFGRLTHGHRTGRGLVSGGMSGRLGAIEGGLGGLGAAGAVGLGVGALYELAKVMYSIPGSISRAANGLISTAQPFMQFQQGTSDIANSGGYGASSLRSRLRPDRGVPPLWQQRYGLGANDVNSIYGAYGNRGDNGAMLQGIVSASAMANQTSYLGGLGANTYAQGLGQYETLTGNSYIRPNPGDVDVGQPGANSSTQTYFKKLQQVMQSATVYGLDHSKVYSTLNGLFQSQALAGGANLDFGKTSGYWNRMASGGLASMRSGEGIAQSLSGISSAISSTGYGGDSVRTMALQSYFAKHGGMPKTVGALGKMLGFDPSNLSPTEQKMAQNAVESAKNGNVLAFQTAIQPFEQSNPQFFQTVGNEFANQLPGDSTTRSVIAGNVSGGGYAGTVANQTGQTNMAATSGPVYGSVSDDRYQDIMNAAKKAGVDPSWLMAIAGQESGYGTNKNTYASGGMFQVTQGTFLDAQKRGLIDKNLKYSDVVNDDNLNSQVGAAILADKQRAVGGDINKAVVAYNGGGDPNYYSHVSRFHDTIGNSNTDQNTLLSRGQALNMNQAEQAYNTGVAAFNGPAGDALIKFSGNVVDATGAVAQFTTAIQNFLAKGGFLGAPASHNGSTFDNSTAAGRSKYNVNRYPAMP